MKDTIEKIKKLQEESNQLKTKAAAKTSKLDDEITKLKGQMNATIESMDKEMKAIIKAKENLDKRHEKFVKNLSKEGLTVVDGKIEISNSPTIESINEILKSEDLIIEAIAMRVYGWRNPVDRLGNLWGFWGNKVGEYRDYIEENEIKITTEQVDRGLELVESIYGELKLVDKEQSGFDEGRFEEELVFELGGEFTFTIETYVDGREGHHITSVYDAQGSPKEIKLY